MEIKGHPEYLIYPDGRVWSNRKAQGRFLKAQMNTVGYYQVSLGRGEQNMIHRLVGIHYIPNPDNLPVIDHINRDRSDNRICNLRWSTYSQNSQNTKVSKSNKSGHKCISYQSRDKRWRYCKRYRKKTYNRFFVNKIDALCYKYIILLKIKYLKNCDL